MNHLPENRKCRDSNIELLRIISMFLVIYSHFASHSKFDFSDNILCVNQLLIQMGRLGEIGVSLFLLISGYYSVKAKQSVSGYLRLFEKVLLCNVIIVVVFIFAGREISFGEAIRNILPIYRTHWFAYTFFSLYILIPYINQLIYSLGPSKHLQFIVIIGVLWGGVHTILGADFAYSELAWFIFLYMTGAYFRLYGTGKINSKKCIVIAICTICLLWISTILIDVMEIALNIPMQKYGNYFYSLYSPFIFVISTIIFVLFTRIRLKTNWIINTVARTTFGIYIISDHNYMRDYIWNKLFNNVQYSQSSFIVLVGFVECIGVFASCGLCDYVISKILEQRCVESLNSKIEHNVKKVIEKGICFINKAIR